MAMQGYLNSPEYQQWVAMQQQNQMNNLRTPGSALASVLTSGVNALGMKRAKAQYDAKEMQKASLYASLLQHDPVSNVGITPALNNPETSAADWQSRKDTGAYDQPTSQAPDMQTLLSRLVALPKSEASAELQQQIAPAIMQAQFAANQPPSQYQRQVLGQQETQNAFQRANITENNRFRDVQAVNAAEDSVNEALRKSRTDSPQYKGDVAGAEAAAKAPYTTPRAPTTAGGLQFNTATGQWDKIPGYLESQTDLAKATTGARADIATEHAAIDLNDPADKSYIDSIANYKVRVPSAGRNPQQRKAVIEAALKVNPGFNEGKYDQSAKALRDFGTGKQGDVARSLNVSVAHLETLRELGRALNNGNITLINAAKQRFSEEFGVPAPTNFDTAKSIVADEVAKGVIGGQSAQSDRDTLAASLRRSGSFPVIEGAINTFQSLLGGQLGGLRSQYERTTGAKDFDASFLSEATRRALEGGDLGAASGGSPKVGDIEDGHRFKGGNPADPNSWEKVQ